MNTAALHPKNTFANLPSEKRRRILEAAVAEFAGHGYQKASLNRIVQRLGIAKGSLYQYFLNKEALFLYIFSSFTTLVKQLVRDEIVSGQSHDFFGKVRAVLLAGIKFIRKYPEYFQIYLQVLFEADVPHREELIREVRLFSAEFFGPLCVEAQQQGEIRNDIASEMVIFVLDALLDRFLQGYARPYLDGGLQLAGESETQLQQKINMVIQVLRDGLAPKVR